MTTLKNKPCERKDCKTQLQGKKIQEVFLEF